MGKKYIRDGRAPIPKDEKTSEIMSKIKGKDTKPELLLRKALREVGRPGYRLQWKKAHGRLDIAYPGRKIAIFVHGCYWHRCPHCDLSIPKSNTEWWEKKFERNIRRDKEKEKALKDAGWKVYIFWECNIKDNPLKAAEVVKNSI